MLSPDQQQELLDNVVEEFTHRLRQGQRPAIAEFTDRYPSLSCEIEELLTSVAMIEELKTQSNTVTDSLKNEMKQITRLERIGDYRIIRELGRGGMGVVFEAIHESLGRRVAIKVMPNRKFDDQKYQERFRREAQAAATLHHTNIVSVFGIGQTGDHHYYVMEFVDGESLSNILKRLNSFYESNTEDGLVSETMPEVNSIEDQDDYDFQLRQPRSETPELRFNSARQRYRWAAQIGAQLADGLAYAHGLGMLHRDVKPANLLIDKNETVWLTDFGLVKNISNQSITKTGDIIGTPQYMAPESFEGNYDHRSETYCLGLTLYEMATLRPAYENASTPELIRRITTTSPISPKKLEPWIPRDLNRIIQKSISREPDYRYQSAIEMRDDLRAFLDDRPISARKISMFENMWRWSRRNPVQAFLSFISAFMLLTIAVGATVALIVNRQLTTEIEQRFKSLNVQVRATQSAQREREDLIDLTVQSYDRLFKSIVFKDAEIGNEFSLDGFGDLEGVSATIKETDAELLDQMKQFYLGFANNKKNQTNLQLKSLVAFSHRRVANIYHLTSQFDKAVESYKQSIELYNEVRNSSPNNLKPFLSLVTTINECGKAYELKGSRLDRRMAEKQFERSIEILRERAELFNDEDSTIVQSELAKSLLLKGTPTVVYRYRLPDTFSEISRWLEKHRSFGRSMPSKNSIQVFGVANSQQSVREIQEALEITNELSDAYRINQTKRVLDSVAAYIRCGWHYMNWNFAKSKSAGAFAIYKLHRFLGDFSRNEELRYMKATGLTRLGTIQLVNERIPSARQSLRNATALMVGLVESDKSNPEYRFQLAQVKAVSDLRAFKNTQGGKELSKLEEMYVARSLNNSKLIMLELLEDYENNLSYRRMLAEVSFRLGVIHRKYGRNDDAIKNFTIANEMYSNLMPQTPRNHQIQWNGLVSLLYLADVFIKNKDFNQAIVAIEQKIDSKNESPVQFSRFPTRKFATTILYHALQIAYEENGDKQMALEILNQELNPRRMQIRGNRMRTNFGRSRSSSRSPN